jgi:eukaryotic-like serine/threonine-protein kinase
MVRERNARKDHLLVNERELFIAALQIEDPAGRSACLDKACGDDAELRQRVEALLQAFTQAGSFLQQPAADPGATSDVPPAEPSQNSAPAEGPGAVIGPYKLLQQIGEGGMGTVFMAEQTQPVKRKVALKVIKAGMDSRQVIARFEAERQALAMMDHVNIARVLDAGTTDAGRPYFVMELVHGVPITKYCDDNHLTPRERLELFVPVCQAIQHAHQKGIIHRDVKPSNVMVTLYDGKPVPKVIDFGVAKATEQKLTERTLFTQYGTMVGTLEYMSPEQAEMSALGVDTRSDIYSLGVLLYELLTGSTPLTRKRFKDAAYGEILRIIKEEEPPKPSTRLSDSGEALASISAQRKTEPAKLSKLMRGELDWIVMKTLEKDRNRRYETANAFAADVQRYLNDEPVQACPPSAGYRFRKFARRHKRVLATVGLLALALIVGTVVSAWQAIRAKQAEGLAQIGLQKETEAQKATLTQLGLTEEAQEKATRRLFDARLAQAKAGSLSRRVGQRLGSLDAVAEATKIARDLKLPDEHLLQLRNAAIACLARPDLRLSEQGLVSVPGRTHVDYDGKLEQVALADSHGAVSIRRVADDVEIARLPATGSETWLVFSRDGKFLRTSCASRLNLWKLGGDEPVRVEHLDDACGADFSADSRQFAIGRVDGSIRLYDLASGQPPRELPRGRRVSQLAFHPDGRQLALSCDTSVEIRALDTGEVVADLRGPVAPTYLAWRPDGKTLAVVGSDSRIYLWDVAAGKQTLVIEGIRNAGVAIAFNHAGDLLASTGWEGKLRLWDPQTGKQLFSTVSGIEVPRFSPDDRLLSCDGRDGKLRLWEVAAGGEYRTLLRAADAGKGEYFITSIRSDGRLLAVAMWHGVGLWELPSGKELSFLESPGTNFVLFEPSGALLTNGASGLVRWPVQIDPPPLNPPLAKGWLQGSTLRIGPPHKVAVPGPVCHVACNSDGQVIAVSQFQGGRVLLAARPDQPVSFGPHDDARYVAVSPDGLWVATGSHNGTGVKIWDALTGECKKELPVDGSRVGFSPDGKWLATNGGGLRLWAVGSWWEGPRIGGGVFAFSPDLKSPSGKLLAVETSYGAVRLVNPDTGWEYARLEDPDLDRALELSFNADGTQLIVSTEDSRSIHVWDLRAIRERLAKMELDWDLPPYLPPAPDLKPLRVEVDPGDLGAMIQAQALGRQADDFVQSKQWDKAIGAYTQAVEFDPKFARAWSNRGNAYAGLHQYEQALADYSKAIELDPKFATAWSNCGVAYTHLGQWDKAVADLSRILELAPDNAELHNNLAWFLATCPDAKFRDPGRAVELAKKAVELSPKEGTYWNTLGAAHYRAGDWKASIAAMEKSMELRKGGDSFDFFFLAMAHWQLGHKDEAQKWHEKGVQWMQKNEEALKKDKMHDEELRRFRAEAEALLKVE